MSEGAIPWGAVNEYALRNGFDREQSALLLEHVRALDAAYLKWKVEQRKDG